jgi:CheY-like chemotaxis protein
MPNGQVLVVDDQPGIGTGLARLFLANGIDATAVPSASAALEAMHRRTPEALVLDLNMPGMDGLTLLRTIRNDAQLRELPVVICTADMSSARRREAEAIGISAYVIKGEWLRVVDRVATLLGVAGQSHDSLRH